MPSQNPANLPGFNKARSTRDINNNIGATKAAGTNSKLDAIGLARTQEIDGGSESISNGVVVARSDIAFATSTQAIGTPDTIRKGIEAPVIDSIGGNGMNIKTTDREVGLQGIGLKQLVDGRWVDGAGAIATPASTGVTYNQIVAGQGDTDTRGRNYAQDYNVRVGLNNSELNLGLRRN